MIGYQHPKLLTVARSKAAIVAALVALTLGTLSPLTAVGQAQETATPDQGQMPQGQGFGPQGDGNLQPPNGVDRGNFSPPELRNQSDDKDGIGTGTAVAVAAGGVLLSIGGGALGGYLFTRKRLQQPSGNLPTTTSLPAKELNEEDPPTETVEIKQ